MSVPSVSLILWSLGAAALAFAVWKLFKFLAYPYSSTLRNLPGPPSHSWIWGNIKELIAASERSEEFALFNEWVEQFGTTYRYKVWANYDRLWTVDTKAISHVLSHSYDFPKPEMTRLDLAEILGPGLVVAEGEHHRQQRRIMNPAFGPAQIRELTEIFVEKAKQLRDVWSATLVENGGSARVDVASGLTNMTLDVIGLAGFNYDFDALNPGRKETELGAAFRAMFQSLTSTENSTYRVLRAYVPILRHIPDGPTRRMAAAQEVARRIGLQLVAEKKAAVRKAAQTGEKGMGQSLESRDLLTLLIKANMNPEIPESQRLSDDDVLAQVPTFLVAGHETTSNATTMCLFALANAPDVQHKLREELWGVPTEDPTMDELNGLPYLDAVVRETMRVHPPVIATARMPLKDEVIPLETPYTDVHGKMHDSVTLSKDTLFIIPIMPLNKSKALWGPDALEFKPERWESLPESVQHIPGVWGNMLTFLGGPRACIGYRFSLVEMKALVFTLVRAFEFDPAVAPEEIIKKSAVVNRPYVRSEMEKGTQMPILIKAYVRA